MKVLIRIELFCDVPDIVFFQYAQSIRFLYVRFLQPSTRNVKARNRKSCTTAKNDVSPLALVYPWRNSLVVQREGVRDHIR